MSTRLAIFLCALATPPAFAQSPDLLHALHMQTPQPMHLAETELAHCQQKACPQLHNLQLLLGVLCLSQAQIPRAVALLSAAAPPAPLLPFQRWYLAEAQAYAGLLPEALRSLHAIDGPPWLLAKATLRTAELQLLSGQYALSLKTLEGLSAQTPEIRFLHALNLLSMGQQEKALAPLQQLSIQFPGHPHGLWAEQTLSSPPLSRLPASRRAAPERLLRAQNLVGEGSLSQALAELERLPKKLAPKEAAQAAFWRARILFSLGKTEAATKHIGLALKGAPQTAQQAAWLMARRHMRSQENEVARQWLAKAEAGGGKLAQEARFLSAWLWLNASQWQEAETALAAFAEQYSHSSFAVDARWFQGWAQFRQNNCSQASQTWQNAAEQYPHSPLLAQFHYWIARCAPHGTEAETATRLQAFAQVAERFPGSLYGRMAQQQAQAEAPLFRPLALPLGPHPLPPRLSLAFALFQTGLLADVHRELEEVRKQTRGAEEALRMGIHMQSLGAYGVAYALAARHLWGAAFSRRESPALALLFPQAFEAEVLAAAHAHGLPPALIWAVMRRESAFATSALSHANARGLMQIIPPTGQRIAERLNTPLPHADALFAPALNISFGSWYLKQLVERFGHLAPAVAAYNAGPKAVARWVEARGELPLDAWIEEIPFRETRHYVKQVLADVYAFAEMYATPAGAPPPPWQWTLPQPRTEGVQF